MHSLEFYPSKEEFGRLASFPTVPVGVAIRIRLGGEGLLSLIDPERPCWVLSECLVENAPYEPISYLIEANAPFLSLKGYEINGDSLFSIRELLRPMPPVNGLPRFQGGAWGLFSYDICEVLEPYLCGKIKRSGLPGLVILEAKDFVAYSPKHGMLFLIEAKDPGPSSPLRERYTERLDKLVLRMSKILSRLERTPDRSHPTKRPTLVPLSSKSSFIASVGELKDAIASGECIQVVLSQRFIVEDPSDPLVAYSLLRSRNPSPYSCFLRCGDFYLIASSPEMLVRAQGDEVVLRPIAGTRPRTGTPEGDILATRSLLSDPKETAEHMMLLDLGRNDLGRIALPGSVKVIQRAVVEYYSKVIHLVSEVRGKLGSTPMLEELLRATFPAGTVTGAPKLRAMELIERMEEVPRGPYAGGFGLMGANGFVDIGITIRAAFGTSERMFVQAGAGIVLDSDPQREYEETLHKAGAVLEALGL